MRATYVYLDKAAVAWSSTAVGQLVNASTAVPLVHIPLRHPLSYRAGGRHTGVARSQASFVPRGAGYLLGYGPESPILTLALSASELKHELASRGRESADADGRGLAAHTLDSGARTQLESILDDLRATGPLAPDDPASTAIGTRLVSWVADLVARERLDSAASAAASARLRKVEDWIDAHLGEPITLGQLCSVAGMEASSLRKSFRMRRGVSPMDWVWQRRMAAARMRLLSAVPGEKVIHIASDCGLNHAGRFSVEYRQNFGESPSFTLARARDR